MCAYAEQSPGWCHFEGCNVEAGSVIDGANGVTRDQCERFRPRNEEDSCFVT